MKTLNTLSLALLMLLTVFSCQKNDKVSGVEEPQEENPAPLFKSVNRTLMINGDNGQWEVALDEVEGDGMAVFKELEFENGRVRLEIKGQNKPGQSFVGFAFNIQNDSTYEAIYFRPFNFVAEEQIRREHMVQYIYHPEFTWRQLRETRTGKFENEIVDPPDPDSWFAAIVEVDSEQVKVYLDGREEPILEVNRLAQPETSRIAYWVGFNSAGSFRNLQIL